MIIVLIGWIEIQLALAVLRKNGMIDLPEHAQLIIRPKCLKVTGSNFSEALIIGEVDTEVEVSKNELIIVLLCI